MKTEENISPEVKELLDALAEPHANQQRQDQLSQLIDNLSAQEKATSRRALWPWAGMAVAAACAALFIIRMPNNSVPTTMSEAVAHTDIPTQVTTNTQEPINEKTADIAMPVKHHTPTLLAQAIETETIENVEITAVEDYTTMVGETAEEAVTLEPSAIKVAPPAAKPTRRVVACNKLVCYDCGTKHGRDREYRDTDKTILGTPTTPNMDGGMLMLASL